MISDCNTGDMLAERLEQATSKEGLLRADMAKRSGQGSCKWGPYMREIAAAKGYAYSMEKAGRGNLFRLTKKK